MGDPSTTSQVHPGRLTRALLTSAVSRGAQLLRGTVTGLQLEKVDGGHKVTGRTKRTFGCALYLWTGMCPSRSMLVFMALPYQFTSSPSHCRRPRTQPLSYPL